MGKNTQNYENDTNDRDQMDAQKDGRTDGWTNEWSDGQRDGLID